MKVLQQLPVDNGMLSEPKFEGLGPRVWDWDPSKKEFKKASSWLGHALVMSQNVPYFDAKLAGRPDEMDPMNYVSPELGGYLASRLWCRFATVKEWQNTFDQELKEERAAKAEGWVATRR